MKRLNRTDTAALELQFNRGDQFDAEGYANAIMDAMETANKDEPTIPVYNGPDWPLYELDSVITEQKAGVKFDDTSLNTLIRVHEALAKGFNPANKAESVHTDDEAVERFAEAMKHKLALAREKGRSGWQHMGSAELSAMLYHHVEKGDPRDVANFCMFLWHQGAGIHPCEKNKAEPVGHVVQEIDGSNKRLAWCSTKALYHTPCGTKLYKEPCPDRTAELEAKIAQLESQRNQWAELFAEVRSKGVELEAQVKVLRDELENIEKIACCTVNAKTTLEQCRESLSSIAKKCDAALAHKGE